MDASFPRESKAKFWWVEPTLISGYLNAPELNSASFVNGWFKSGDIGSIDEDGFLTLHGRKNDLINRGGEKISPAEIDDALMRHPAIAEAAAFSVPHPRLGEDVVAAVVLRSGDGYSVELRKYLQERITPFKVPRRIVIRDRFPRDLAKVQRWQLTESGKNVHVLPLVATPQFASNIAGTPGKGTFVNLGMFAENRASLHRRRFFRDGRRFASSS